MEIIMKMEKATKNCVKFAEVLENEFMPEKLGSIYVQKSALAEIGYRGGDLTVRIALNGADLNGGNLIAFQYEKATKNTCKFAEIVANEWTPEKIGSIYIPKSTLAEMGYDGTCVIIVELSAE